MTRRSLWAIPTRRDGAPFVRWIERLAAATKSATFAPHVTLVGSVPAAVAEATIGDAAEAFAPFEVTLVNLADSDRRMRCIAALAAADPPLLDIRAAVVAACGVETTAYTPHLSLLYAELSRDERKAWRETVDLAFPTTILVDAVCLVDTTGDDAGRWVTKRTWPLRYGP